MDLELPETLLDSIGPIGAQRARGPSRQDSTAGAFAQNVSIVRMQQKHHRLASLCSTGMTDVEVAALTGYTPQYVYNLRGYNPAFQELVAHYAREAQTALLDLSAKQQLLAEMALDEMTERMGENPKDFTNRELLEVVETNLVKPALGAHGSQSSSAPSPVTIQFVSAPPTALGDATPKIIEGELQK